MSSSIEPPATESPLPANVASSFRTELERLLRGELPASARREIERVLDNELFQRREGLTDGESAALAYRRARFVATALGITATELRTDPRRLYALHESLGLVDGVACTVLSIHYCLALGSLVVHGGERPALRSFVAELERVDSVGVFLATELGYGNNVAALETRAVYDPERREFTLSSPTPASSKFMPNTGHPVPKLAVVMARLISLGQDCGVFPFVVRLRGRDGVPCPGVEIAPLGEKPGYALDNAITRFDRVRIPKSHLLEGSESILHEDGRFESRFASHRQRFLSAMDRVQTGRVCFTSASASSLRAATWVAVRYLHQRVSFAPGKQRVPLLRFRNVQRDVFGALASAYAVTFGVRHLQSCARRRTPETEQEVFRLIATLKAVVTAEVSEALPRLRERCGAVGMLSSNRILEYWNQLQGVITAEGDNQLMLLKAGRQLFDGPLLEVPEIPAGDDPSGPERLVLLLRYREARLLAELRASAGEARRRTRDVFAIWNGSVNRTLALATAHGLRILAECFHSALSTCVDGASRQALEALFSLWGVMQLERHSGWFLSEGVLSSDWVRDIPSRRDRWCEVLEPQARELVDAFGLENAGLQAPIAEPDYVAAYYGQAERAVAARRGSGTFRFVTVDDVGLERASRMK